MSKIKSKISKIKLGKPSKYLLIPFVVGLVFSAVFTQFSTSKYPPCEIKDKGIGVVTYGCVINPPSAEYPCKNERARSKAMADCVNANYYRNKTFPFGFTQPFGKESSKLDSGPIVKNSALSYLSGFLLTAILMYLIPRVKKRVKNSKKANVAESKKPKTNKQES